MNKKNRQTHEAQRQQELSSASAIARLWAVGNGLPTLAGSEKQVAWAERIRKIKIEALLRPGETSEVAAWMKAQASSGWWIGVARRWTCIEQAEAEMDRRGRQ